MKILYLIIVTFSLILIGCSSTYKASDFPSKDKFYEDFKNSSKDKSVTVTFTNDSSFYINNGVEIANDTLYSVGYINTNHNWKIAIAEINNIRYTNLDYKTGDILFKNGELIQAEKIKIISDSIEFTETRRLITKDYISNINKVKKIVYNKHWPGMIPGFVCGFLGSFVIAGIGEARSRNSDEGFFATGGAMIIGVPVGTLLGTAIGWFIGYDGTYQFTP